MFQEVAKKMRLGHRNIQVKNTGLSLRLFLGYHNALACGPLNCVYLNADILNHLSDKASEALMGHELAHFRHRLPHAKNLLSNYLPVMLNPQVAQIYELDADSQTFNVGKLDPQGGIELMKYLQNPDLSKWPLYAKLQFYLLVNPIEKLTSLPLLEFLRTHPTYAKRIANLEQLKIKYNELNKKK